MSETENQNAKKRINPDWLIRGVLGKLGEIFDNLTGRKWQPSSNLATSELAEKLVFLLDSNLKDLGVKGKFVPHYITLKMQWDKFSTESETALSKLEIALLSAAVDHINDFHLHTFAPLRIEIKTDYFTEGVMLTTSFEDLGEDDGINLSLPQLDIPVNDSPKIGHTNNFLTFNAKWIIDNQEKTAILKFSDNERLGVGRALQNALQINDPSLSKNHASLYITSENQLSLADTGSTNGTFINDQRISYGQSFIVNSGDRVQFGSVVVYFEPAASLPVEMELGVNSESSINLGEFEFRNSKTDPNKTSVKNITGVDLEKEK